MKRSEIKVAKKLIGVYKQCINATVFNKNTKHFRKLTQARIEKVQLS
jgi:hypothetical protein